MTYTKKCRVCGLIRSSEEMYCVNGCNNVTVVIPEVVVGETSVVIDGRCLMAEVLTSASITFRVAN